MAVLRSRAPVLQALRTVGLLGSALFFVASLPHLPLATASAIGFAAPLFVTVLSIPLLGEVVGFRRWAALVVGLVGVLIVIRPGSGAFDVASLLPLASALFWAAGLIVTRRIGYRDRAVTTLAYAALIGLLLLTLVVPFAWTTPSGTEMALAAAMAAASTAAQFLVVLAYRLARASVLAPLAYSQIVWSGLLGLVVFASVPDAATWLGTAVIVASGLYTAHRERIVARRPRST